MLTRYGFFSFLFVLTLAGLPAVGQTGVLGNGQPSAIAVIDCRALLQPFPEINFSGSPTNELALEVLAGFDTRLTPYDEQVTASAGVSRSKGEGARTAGLTLTFTGLGIMGVTGLVYLTEYLVNYTCRTLNTCASYSGTEGISSPGQIGNLPYIIALSVGGGVMLIGLIMTVSS